MNRDQLESALHISPGEIVARLELELKATLDRMNRDRMVLGLSGGIDSAVVAWLCRRVMEGSKVTALIMPDKESNKKNTEDAIAIARQLGIDYRVIELDRYLESARVRFPVPFIGNKQKARLVRFFYGRLKARTGETPFQTILKGGSGSIYNRYLNKGTANYRFKHRLRLTFLYRQPKKPTPWWLAAPIVPKR
jgi:NAD+ synthase